MKQEDVHTLLHELDCAPKVLQRLKVFARMVSLPYEPFHPVVQEYIEKTLQAPAAQKAFLLEAIRILDALEHEVAGLRKLVLRDIRAWELLEHLNEHCKSCPLYSNSSGAIDLMDSESGLVN